MKQNINNKKILILGASGMAGSMIFTYLKSYFDIKGLDRSQFNPLIHDITKQNFDKYDYVINCIGIIKQKESSIDDLYYINGKFPNLLAENVKKLIHISSDCVFNGKLNLHQSYSSQEIPAPMDDYGKSKLQGEPITKSMVLRTSIIGPAKDNYGLFEWFRNNSQNDINGYINHWWSGVTTLELSKIIHKIIEEDSYKVGLYHVGSNKINKYSLLNIINNIFKLNKNIIPYYDINYINRSLISDIECLDINKQILELYEFLK